MESAARAKSLLRSYRAMKTQHRLATVATIAALVLAACGEEEPSPTAAPPSPTPESFVEVTPESPEPSPLPPEPERVQVPDVEGRSVGVARRLLMDQGLAVSVSRRPSDQPPGTVTQQRPEAGRMRQPGALVKLVVAKPRPEPPPPPDDDDGGNCTPGYSPCLPPASDYDCAGGSGDGPAYTGTVTVTGSDPYGLDADGDGVGCE